MRVLLDDIGMTAILPAYMETRRACGQARRKIEKAIDRKSGVSRAPTGRKESGSAGRIDSRRERSTGLQSRSGGPKIFSAALFLLAGFVGAGVLLVLCVRRLNSAAFVRGLGWRALLLAAAAGGNATLIDWFTVLCHVRRPSLLREPKRSLPRRNVAVGGSCYPE